MQTCVRAEEGASERLVYSFALLPVAEIPNRASNIVYGNGEGQTGLDVEASRSVDESFE